MTEGQDRKVEVIFSPEEIGSRVSELAEEIKAAGLDRLLVVAVLKGSFVFAADLMRALDRAGLILRIDFMRLRSYGHAKESSGVVRSVGPMPDDLAGRDVLLVDDIVDTAGTLTKVAEAIKIAGAREIIASCSHGVLSGHALERIEKSPLSKLIITDSMPHSAEKRESEKIVVLTIAELLARAIKNIHDETSVTSLFV